jgi:hypothetical protein
MTTPENGKNVWNKELPRESERSADPSGGAHLLLRSGWQTINIGDVAHTPGVLAMLEAMAEWMGYPLYYAMDGAPPPPRTGAAHSSIFPYGPYATAAGANRVPMPPAAALRSRPQSR